MRCDTVLRHLRVSHNSTEPRKCVYCDIVFGKLYELQSHVTEQHDIRNPNSTSQAKELTFSCEQHATKNFFQPYRMNIREQLDLLSLIKSLKEEIIDFTRSKITENGPIKLQMSVYANLIKPLDEAKVSCHSSSYSKPVLSSLLEEGYFDIVDQMISGLQVFFRSGNGYIIESLEHLDININLYKPI